MKIKKKQLQHIYEVLEGEKISYLQETMGKWYPELFKEQVQIGKWYKSKRHEKMLIFPEKIDDRGHLYGYGLDNNGDWVSDGNYADGSCLCNNVAAKDLILATEEEVKDALVKEAKKRGFKEGAGFNNSTLLGPHAFEGELSFHENMGFNLYGSNYSGFVFDSEVGEWSEIIEEMTVEEKLKTYELVNSTESLLGLANIIRSLADEKGFIKGKTRKFNAEKMAQCCLNFSNVPFNTLTREFGIRQQAIYISRFQ